MNIISHKFSIAFHATFKVESQQRDSKIRNTFKVIGIYRQVLSSEVMKVSQLETAYNKTLLKVHGIKFNIVSVLFTFGEPGGVWEWVWLGEGYFITADV